jgi:hypothetical protein
MKKLLLAFALILAVSPAGTRPAARPIPTWERRCELAFCLMPSASSAPVTFAILTWYDKTSERPDEVRVITRHEFLTIAHGIIPSEANPKQEDLFAKYEVKDCNFEFDPLTKKANFNCSVVDDLWRLRNRNYPFKVPAPPKGSGWGALPDEMSWGQLEYLGKYGVRSRNDYFFGENAFKLMKDMQDPDWVSSYAKN